MLSVRILLITLFAAVTAVSQLPSMEPGVSQDLAKWRSVQYSNISYKLNLTLEKMSPVLKGSIEIHVTQAASACAEPNCPPLYLILDWRKLPGHEKDSTISNVTLNGHVVAHGEQPSNIGLADIDSLPSQARGHAVAVEVNDHLIFHQGVVMGENVITLDFTSPILTSGSAITRYIDKEDGSEYIYSLFVPSDASTAFPVFDQPDLKARFKVMVVAPEGWAVVSNTRQMMSDNLDVDEFPPTKPISTYLFAFAAGPWKEFGDPTVHCKDTQQTSFHPSGTYRQCEQSLIYVRKSQAAKFQPHAAETFRLTREAVKYLETYFDYKFPWPKYDLVLIPEFPFGGMEHAGATFLKESSVIFPTEPTRGDEISRASVIFHETADQWFGDLVTMRWFDDLWLKEGFAEFMAYKTLEHVMPDANAWKVFYERNKQAAYATDSTRGTTPIYQPISNLSAAKSAYGNIVYRKAPSFLRQAEFYLGQDKFQTAVRAFLKKHEYANAGWEDLVGEFETVGFRHLTDSMGMSNADVERYRTAERERIKAWATLWVSVPDVPTYRIQVEGAVLPDRHAAFSFKQTFPKQTGGEPLQIPTKFNFLAGLENGMRATGTAEIEFGRPPSVFIPSDVRSNNVPVTFLFPNYGDYGYGIFLLDDKSRDYVLKHIGEEKDPFLRSMMWGALWDSVREAELDPREYVELVIRQLGGDALQKPGVQKPARSKGSDSGESTLETDETTIQSLLGRVSTALNYYLPTGALTGVRASATADLRTRFEAILLDRMQHAETPGQRITFYRAFVTNATTEHSRSVLKQMLREGGNPSVSAGAQRSSDSTLRTLPNGRVSASGPGMALRTKDRFDIVTRLAILGDPDASKLLADLEKTETGDDAKRYAYAAHAAFATAENRATFWNDFVNNKDISESWIEAAIVPFNSIRHPELSQPYLARALAELPNLKRTRKIFFINNWLSAWLSGQRDQAALDIVNKFLADNPNLDNDLRLKVLENVDVIERAVKIRQKFAGN